MEVKLLLFVVLGTIGQTVAQLRCYACSFSAADTDQSCLTITDDTNTVPCPHDYCTVTRQEFLDPPGTIASFLRGCEQEPDYLNHEVVDNFFRTFYRACTTTNCNIGNGIQSIVGGNLSPSQEFEGSNLLVPGSNAINFKSSAVTVIIILITLYMFQ